jgi:hypothetical protein
MSTPSTPDSPEHYPPIDDTRPTDIPTTDIPTDDTPAVEIPADDVPAIDTPADDVPAVAPATASTTALMLTTVPRRMRMRTVVLGLVLLVTAGSVLVGQLTDITVDAGAVFLALMIGGGVLLIAGARRS